ncbi:MAG: enoyl-CoA hydratase-related protein [Xylophilus ampelinus]
MPTELLSTGEGRITILALSSADGRNLLAPAVYAAGIEALNTAADSADVDAVVLAGQGTHFSWGEDLEALRASARPRAPSDASDADGFARADLRDWMEAIATFPKPLIAAVEGTAAGAGLALALACDLVVASDRAAFSLPHAALGVLPAAGAIWHAARGVPAPLAMELLLDGTPMPATRLQAVGLVNRIAAPGAARAEAIAWAARLAGVPAALVADIKELHGAARELPLDAFLEREHGRRLHHLHRESTQRALANPGAVHRAIS